LETKEIVEPELSVSITQERDKGPKGIGGLPEFFNITVNLQGSDDSCL
jgi:hypothetical protein